MILQSCAVTIASKRPQRLTCFASIAKTNAEQLRTQLDQLHAEADSTRAKANSARLRLMRLSEAAEKFKRQAAISLHSGGENEARELLFQKKKLVQTMERSKSHIELLDELSAKLNEAISLKESQLIGNIAFDLEVDKEDISGLVRVVSPTKGLTDDTPIEEKIFYPDAPKHTESTDFQFSSNSEAIPPPDKVLESYNMGLFNEDSIIRGLEDITSYEVFLEQLDLQLKRIEAELATILKVSTWIPNDKNLKNPKFQQTIEILESIHAVRQRITSIMQSSIGIR